MIPTLATERLQLRELTLADAARVRELAGDARVAETTAEIPHPYEEGMAEQWLGSLPILAGAGRLVWGVVHPEHGLVGCIELRIEREHERAETGYWIGVPYWGQGFATEALRAVCRYGFEDLGLGRIYAQHVAWNPASGRVLEKAGMTREGVLRRHVRARGRSEDTVVWGMLRAEHR
ncbi:MAG: GNAT family N-acetyltransferase [Gemmatimonadetes bacterium]|nr:GNAT family N-acetyltransferase [Gemmatimonadota bacterium]